MRLCIHNRPFVNFIFINWLRIILHSIVWLIGLKLWQQFVVLESLLIVDKFHSHTPVFMTAQVLWYWPWRPALVFKSFILHAGGWMGGVSCMLRDRCVLLQIPVACQVNCLSYILILQYFDITRIKLNNNQGFH